MAISILTISRTFKLATFGVDWAYFYLQPDGRWLFDDPGYCYKTLSEIMDDLDDGDIEVNQSFPFQDHC